MTVEERLGEAIVRALKRDEICGVLVWTARALNDAEWSIGITAVDRAAMLPLGSVPVVDGILGTEPPPVIATGGQAYLRKAVECFDRLLNAKRDGETTRANAQDLVEQAVALLRTRPEHERCMRIEVLGDGRVSAGVGSRESLIWRSYVAEDLTEALTGALAAAARPDSGPQPERGGR